MIEVEVLLSSYNGRKYIEEQIESVMMQNGVKTHLTIRDDGSRDETLQLIEKMIDKYSGRISCIRGNNIGYRRSFLKLLSKAYPAEYYCFCDQDDVWMPNKIINAINKISNLDTGKPLLYASGVIITDEKLNKIGENRVSNMPHSIESYFTRGRLPGCTFVFNNSLLDIVNRFSTIEIEESMMPDHDVVVGSCAFACGTVYIDSDSYILHRRHNASVTNGGTGIKKRIRSEWNLVFHRKNVRYYLASEMLSKISEEELGKSQKLFLEQIVNYKKSLRGKFNLLNNHKMTTKIFICDLESKIKILLGNY